LPLTDFQNISLRHLYRLGRLPDLKNPKTFNEKILWLNLFSEIEKYSMLADKYAVREFVNEKIGTKYLKKILGVYRRVDDIQFEDLPDNCVLKATHGSGMLVFCRDKKFENQDTVKKEMKEWLKTDYYKLYRERVYKDIPPGIICEELIEDKNLNGIIEYKFLCFNGRVKIINVVFFYDIYAEDYYDREWNFLPFSDFRHGPTRIEKPKEFEEMVRISETLAKDIPFVRVDLMLANSKIYFGEMTFSPAAGFGKFIPKEWDSILGSYLELPAEKSDSNKKSY